MQTYLAVLFFHILFTVQYDVEAASKIGRIDSTRAYKTFPPRPLKVNGNDSNIIPINEACPNVRSFACEHWDYTKKMCCFTKSNCLPKVGCCQPNFFGCQNFCCNDQDTCDWYEGRGGYFCTLQHEPTLDEILDGSLGDDMEGDIL